MLKPSPIDTHDHEGPPWHQKVELISRKLTASKLLFITSCNDCKLLHKLNRIYILFLKASKYTAISKKDQVSATGSHSSPNTREKNIEKVNSKTFCKTDEPSLGKGGCEMIGDLPPPRGFPGRLCVLRSPGRAAVRSPSGSGRQSVGQMPWEREMLLGEVAAELYVRSLCVLSRHTWVHSQQETIPVGSVDEDNGAMTTGLRLCLLAIAGLDNLTHRAQRRVQHTSLTNVTCKIPKNKIISMKFVSNNNVKNYILQWENTIYPTR